MDHSDYLDASAGNLKKKVLQLKWDGKDRLTTFFERYAAAAPPGTADVEIRRIRTAGKAWLEMAVNRLLEPGADAGPTLVLLAPQGAGKTRFIQTLAGGASLEVSSPRALLDPEALSLMSTTWLVGVGESGRPKLVADKIREFVDRRVDHYRQPYLKQISIVPRAFVVVGMVSTDQEHARDLFDTRRFVAIKCHRFDLAALDRDRDQILAQAVESTAPWRTDASKTLRRFSDDAQVLQFPTRPKAEPPARDAPREPAPVAQAVSYELVFSTQGAPRELVPPTSRPPGPETQQVLVMSAAIALAIAASLAALTALAYDIGLRVGQERSKLEATRKTTPSTEM